LDNKTRSRTKAAASLIALFLIVGLLVFAGQDAKGAQGPMGKAPASISMEHIRDFAGKLHPIVLHFPISLILTTLLAEILGLISGKPIFFQTARFTLILAALSVVFTVPLGWAAAVSKEYPDDYARILWLHRWFGTTTGVLTIFAACLSELSHFRRERAGIRMAYRIALVAASATVTFTGHFGALLVYGINYFSE